MKPVEAEALPVKHATFVAEYLVDYNGAAAAAAAGYSKKRHTSRQTEC